MSTTIVGQRRRARCAILSLTTILAAGMASPALAQLAPVRQSVDGNGVDLFSGTLSLSAPAISIGGSDQGMAYAQVNQGGGWADNMVAVINGTSTSPTISLGGQSDRFTLSGSAYVGTEGNGATLSLNSSIGIYTYTKADGTIVHFSSGLKADAPYTSNLGRATDIVSPSGIKHNYSYTSLTYCKTWKAGSPGDICMTTARLVRLATLQSSYGYRLALDYGDDGGYVYDPSDPSTQPDVEAWLRVTGAHLANLAAPTGSAEVSQTYAVGASGTFATRVVTDAMGRSTTYRMSGSTVLGITLPGSTIEDITFTYANDRLTSVATPAGTTAYSAADASGVRTVTVTDAANHATVYKFDVASQRMTELTDANGKVTTAQYDSSGRLTRVTQPEGNAVQLTYDGRGNLTEQRRIAKSGSGLADIVTTAGYAATCSNALTCNQPLWTKDARGSQTDYTYDASHGGVLSVTSPAPLGGSGARPEVRYSYTSLQAYYDKGAGIVASGEPVVRLTGISMCQTSASCAGTADEIKTSVDYGPQTPGVGNNLLPIATSKGAGDSSLTATVTLGYDAIGNVITTDGPLAGTADTARNRYDANRTLIGTVSPDPDGSGSLKLRATRTTIDARGLTTKQERGTVNSQSDTDWAAFAPAETVDIGYDAARRPVTSKLSAGGTAYALSQTSYDAAGRAECVAQRMNTAAFTSLPASACTLGTPGTDGPDRIIKAVYDNGGQMLQKRVAVGTSAEAVEATVSYTDDGKPATLTDGENNRTTYEYDGHDRLSTTRYPVATKGQSTSSTTDYEQLTYDANSNVAARRLRDAAVISFSYDYLDRPISMGGSTIADRSYTYDLAGRLLGATFQSGGPAFSATYDALGRTLKQTGSLGTTTSQWDVGGRRTKLTYPGTGFYLDYDYLVTGEMTAIKENGSSSGQALLATFSYDDLGRRTLLARGNGTTTSYSHDPVSCLGSFADSFTGGNNNQTTSFVYNPAGQIGTVTRSNDLFAWTGHGSGTTSTVSNGLNQIASINGSATAHDARGNLTTDPASGRSYGYDGENQLVSASGGTLGSASLSYDAVGRLFQLTGTSSNTRFVYDGLDMIAEYDATGALTKRYVHGPGVDEPLVDYSGAGTTSKRWLHADERGSIIAQSDTSGAAVAINRYDEYGKPQTTNYGRFQYTGQAWLGEIGLAYYKARMYSPSLGRFLQTDPIGVEGGINLYGYVGNDPVNATDPMGLKWVTACVGEDGGALRCGPRWVAEDYRLSDVPTRSLEGPQTDREQDCGLGAALAKNKQAIIGDTIGGLASLLPGGRPAVTVVGLAVGAGVLTNTAVTANTQRPELSIGSISIGIAAVHVTSACPLANAYAATSAVARSLPVTGQLLAAGALALDAVNVYKDYKSCPTR